MRNNGSAHKHVIFVGLMLGMLVAAISQTIVSRGPELPGWPESPGRLPVPQSFLWRGKHGQKRRRVDAVAGKLEAQQGALFSYFEAL